MLNLDEFAAYISTPIEDVDAALVDALSREARVLIRRVAPRLPDDVGEWPEAAVVVAMRVVARGYQQALSGVPSNIEQLSQTAGAFSTTTKFTPGGVGGAVWLSKEDKLLLGARGGAYVVDLMPARAVEPPRWWDSL